MKKFSFVFLLIMSISSISFASERPVYCEIESPNAVTYYTKSMNSGWGFKYYKYFVKYVGNNNNTDYWFRISENNIDRFMYSLGIKIDQEEFELPIVTNPNFSQIYSTTGQQAQSFEYVYAIYQVSPEIASKIMQAKTPITLYLNKQNRQRIPLKSDEEFLQVLKKIIGLQYSDKDNYWKPNIDD